MSEIVGSGRCVEEKDLQSIIAGLRERPDLMKIFKETLGLEAKAKEFHPKTFSRMDKFSGDDNHWQERAFNLIMTTKKVSVALSLLHISEPTSPS